MGGRAQPAVRWEEGLCFIHEGKLYSSVEVNTDRPQEVFDRDITDYIHCNSYAVALSRGSETLIFVASEVHEVVKVDISAELSGERRIVKFTLGSGEGRVIEIRRGDERGDGSRGKSQTNRQLSRD